MFHLHKITSKKHILLLIITSLLMMAFSTYVTASTPAKRKQNKSRVKLLESRIKLLEQSRNRLRREKEAVSYAKWELLDELNDYRNGITPSQRNGYQRLLESNKQLSEELVGANRRIKRLEKKLSKNQRYNLSVSVIEHSKYPKPDLSMRYCDLACVAYTKERFNVLNAFVVIAWSLAFWRCMPPRWRKPIARLVLSPIEKSFEWVIDIAIQVIPIVVGLASAWGMLKLGWWYTKDMREKIARENRQWEAARRDRY